jgi:hypothetical protein
LEIEKILFSILVVSSSSFQQNLVLSLAKDYLLGSVEIYSARQTLPAGRQVPDYAGMTIKFNFISASWFFFVY